MVKSCCSSKVLYDEYAEAVVASPYGPAYHHMQSNPIQGNTQQEKKNKHTGLPFKKYNEKHSLQSKNFPDS